MAYKAKSPSKSAQHDKAPGLGDTVKAALGLAFKGTSIRWSEKAFAEFKQRVKDLTGRSGGVSMDQGVLSVKDL
jgi:hypothetical protein